MQPDDFSIGELARRTGCKVQTIRYYEQAGLMPKPRRTRGAQRRYRRRDLERLGFIRHARELGFGLDAIRDLLTLADEPERSCEEADAIARAHLASIESRIARLQALKQEMERMIIECRGGRVADCHVIEVLAAHQHEHCIADDHLRTG
jgi:Cu(I)-responsive transcriptional regulator